MNEDGPLALVIRIARMLDELAITYALGGSMASSFFGEPRATADINVAIRLDETAGEALLERSRAEFYVPIDAARAAIRSNESFNLIGPDTLKVDVFVLGNGILDRHQIERRVRIPLPGLESGLWVTSPEVQVLRKLDWYRKGGSVSDRQWRDVIGIIAVRGPALDHTYLVETARSVGLADLLEQALLDARSTG